MTELPECDARMPCPCGDLELACSKMERSYDGPEGQKVVHYHSCPSALSNDSCPRGHKAKE